MLNRCLHHGSNYDDTFQLRAGADPNRLNGIRPRPVRSSMMIRASADPIHTSANGGGAISNDMVRARQRTRLGIPPLEAAFVPTPSEMLIDKLVLFIPARVWHPSGVEHALEVYRDLWSSQPSTALGKWTRPTREAHKFTTRLDDREGTLAATMTCQNEVDRAAVRLSLTLNPTRTLVHALAHAADMDGQPGMAGLFADLFFKRHTDPKCAATEDGNDNAIGSYAEAASSLGSSIADPLLRIFEDRLRQWVVGALAPLELGFVHDFQSLHPVAHLGDVKVAIAWDKLVIRKAEVYCERRHGTAPDVIERLAARMTSAHAGTSWHRYPTDEHSGRLGGSMSVGFSPTKDIRQAYYAKCKDRIRIETRYDKRVMNSLRYPEAGTQHPLTDKLKSLRADATHRTRYETFCALIAEPKTVTVHDLARFIATVAAMATNAGVCVEPVVASLLATGSLDQTAPDGSAPQRLIDGLVRAGLIERTRLARNRPGDPIRYTLVGPYHQAVRQVQEALQQESER